MKRRQFIGLISSTAAWPLAARGQQKERMRRIGVLTFLAADDSESKIYIGAFVQQLQELGWTVGHNVQIDYRSTAGEADLIRKYAAELIALAPDPERTLPRFCRSRGAKHAGFIFLLAKPTVTLTG
jgi:hypothetical protein